MFLLYKIKDDLNFFVKIKKSCFKAKKKMFKNKKIANFKKNIEKSP